jgi:mono/diheme cytochrome c family protein
MSKAIKMTVGSIVVLAIFMYWLLEHSGFFLYEHNPMQYMPDMHRTPSLKTQRAYPFFADGAAARTTPEGTLAYGQVKYPYTHETPATDVEKKSNPLPASREIVLRGQKVFNSTCINCHGVRGLGNGNVVPPFPAPPSLQSEKIRGFADSQIFHIITVGQNTMGAYGPQIREQDRWAVIHYLRALQRAENPTAEDLKAFDNANPLKKEGDAQ